MSTTTSTRTTRGRCCQHDEIDDRGENYDITLNMVKLEINKALTDDQFARNSRRGRKWCGSTGPNADAPKADAESK